MTQEHGERTQAESELSEEQLDQVAGGDTKGAWPDPKRNALLSSEPSMEK